MFGVNRSYVSEFGIWFKEETAVHTEWSAAQRQSRDLWWNRKSDREAEAGFAAVGVKQAAYPYDVNFRAG